MDSELVFKIILIVQFSVFSIVRIEYQRAVKRAGYKTMMEESVRYLILLFLLIFYEVITLFIYLLYPELISWAAIPIPVWLRWIGVALGILAISLFIWIHRHLGKSFSMKLRIKERQALVTSGPYQWVRHPMYAAFYLLHISSFLLTANWFIGLTWLAGLTIIIALRVKREETMMVSRFGEQYISYMKRTGRFFPVVKLNR